MSLPTWHVTTFYRFLKFENPEAVKTEWDNKAKECNLVGLCILGNEGFNTTCAAKSLEDLNHFKSWVLDNFDCKDMLFKDSVSNVEPFFRFKSKIRNEIVTLGTPEFVPDNVNHKHLSPEEWNKALAEEDVAVVDTRNWYEYEIGSFNKAVNPNIEQFTEFPEFFDKQNYPKDKKILIFCTGGIRCEKGILDLEAAGYNNVYQLEGGILNYLEKKPNDQFWGECFVFDGRVAVDQSLNPSEKYKLCPHCGQPGSIKKDCVRCDTEYVICDKCEQKEVVGSTCSKNCAHHVRLHPGRKGPRQQREHRGQRV